jgi:hypothetical protein
VGLPSDILSVSPMLPCTNPSFLSVFMFFRLRIHILKGFSIHFRRCKYAYRSLCNLISFKYSSDTIIGIEVRLRLFFLLKLNNCLDWQYNDQECSLHE